MEDPPEFDKQQEFVECAVIVCMVLATVAGICWIWTACMS